MRLQKLLRNGSILIAAGMCALSLPVQGAKPAANNMRLVGFDDLQARSAYQPIVHEHPDGRFIAYIGHHRGDAPNPLNGNVVEDNGVSIIDVTDAANPVYLHHLPGNRGAQMVRACNGADLTGANLDGADLSGASLVGADLSNTSLDNTNFTNANLTDAIVLYDIPYNRLGNPNF